MRYLSSVSEDGRTIFRYEEDSYQVDDDSVAEWLGTDDETDLGFIQIDDDSWVKEDNDSDYVPDSSEEEDSTDEEEDEEDEEEEEEENDDYE
jgi:ribonuclease E